MRIKQTFIIATLVLLTSFFLALCCAAQPARAEEPAAAQPTESFDKNHVIVTFDSTSLTLAALEEILNYRKPRQVGRYPTAAILALPDDRLELIVREVIVDTLVFNKAMKEGFLFPDRIKKQLEEQEVNAFGEMLYQKMIVEKVPEVSEGETRKLYDDNIDRYTVPFSFSMRHVFLSTYAEYTVKPNDTLKSIAREITKDERALDRIITDDEQKKPRYVPPDQRETTPYREVTPGEKLLVPIDSVAEQSVKQRMQQIVKELKEGADFVEVAKEYSEAARKGEIIGPIVPSQKPILPEILDAAKKTPVGQITDIIRTKHGYQIMKIERKTEERIRPFSEAKQNIINSEIARKRQERTREYLEELFTSCKELQTFPEVFTDSAATSESIVAKMGDFTYTLREFNRDFGDAARRAASPADKIKLLRNVSAINVALIRNEGKKLHLDETEQFKTRMKHRKIDLVSRTYLEHLIDKEFKMDDQLLKQYHEKQLDRYTEPKKYKVRQIVIRISDNMAALSEEEREEKTAEIVKELNEIKAKIKTVDDFADMAEKHSDDPASAERGGDIGSGSVTDRYRNGFDGNLEKMKVGDVSEPIAMGAFVYLIRVDEITPARVLPFDETKARVAADYRAETRRSSHSTIIDSVLTDANFKYLPKEQPVSAAEATPTPAESPKTQ